MKFRNEICALFIFSLTASALMQQLDAAEVPHVHAEVIKPEITPTVSSGLAASGAIKHLVVDVADQMSPMKDGIRTTLA